MSDMILQGIESLGNRPDTVRASRERFWMRLLHSIQPHGLNIQEGKLINTPFHYPTKFYIFLYHSFCSNHCVFPSIFNSHHYSFYNYFKAYSLCHNWWMIFFCSTRWVTVYGRGLHDNLLPRSTVDASRSAYDRSAIVAWTVGVHLINLLISLS